MNLEMELSKILGEDCDIYIELFLLYFFEGFCDVEFYLICNFFVN